MTLGNLLCPAYVRQLEGSKARERACNASLAAMAMAPLPMCVPCTDPAGVLVQPDMKLPTQVPVSCPNPMTRQSSTNGLARTAVPSRAMEAPMKSLVSIFFRCEFIPFVDLFTMYSFLVQGGVNLAVAARREHPVKTGKRHRQIP